MDQSEPQQAASEQVKKVAADRDTWAAFEASLNAEAKRRKAKALAAIRQYRSDTGSDELSALD